MMETKLTKDRLREMVELSEEEGLSWYYRVPRRRPDGTLLWVAPRLTRREDKADE